MSDSKGFIKFSRSEPKRRAIEFRRHDWKEIYESSPDDLIKQQATRCMDCGVPFCQGYTGCPLENLIPEWNELVQSNRWDEALTQLHRTNNFPEFTGKLCPAPCESACVLGLRQEPVTIRMIESSIIDHGFNSGLVAPVFPVRSSGKKVAVVGSGPAGLAAAQELCRAGHQVTVFEKENRIGGLLRYGIPDFKMEKNILDRRLQQMRTEGVNFQTDTEVGIHIEASNLNEKFEAVCLTLGADQARELDIPGRNLKGIYNAMDFLVQQNKKIAGEIFSDDQRITATGKRVVILGGGDTGSDCLGTVHRQGALEVFQFELMPKPPLSRADSTPWPFWPMQLRTSHAHEEGGKRSWGILTTRFSCQNGQVAKLHAKKIEVKSGQLTPIPQSDFELDVDMVILALGFTGSMPSRIIKDLGIQMSSENTIQVDKNFMTNKKGVFAAGDVKRGASLIVWAIAEGRKMAASVNRFLQSN